jgi:hypothetical protein
MPPLTPAERKPSKPTVESQPKVLPTEQLPKTEQQPSSSEQAPAAAEQPQGTSTTPVQQSVQVQPAAQPTVTLQTPPDDPVADVIQQKTANLTADDVELIEKEWVDVVDDTIEKTKDDPEIEERAQQELNKAYLKKRFNLDVDSSQ